MKPLLLLFIFLLTSLLSFGQAVPVKAFRIQNATTGFGVNISKGTIVYEMEEGKLYIATTGVTSGETLSSATASFDLTYSVPSKLQAPDGSSAIAVSVDNDGNVGINDTSPDGKLEVNPDGVEDNGDEFIVTANGCIGIGTTIPNSSAALEVKSTTKGVLLPQVSLGDVRNLTIGLIIYNTSAGCLSYYDGNNWKNMESNLVAPDGTEVIDIISLSGRTWMDRNLGAPQAATSSTDYEAYGSLFQWCREADGHEQISWNSSTEGTPVNGMTNTLSNTTSPGHSNFIIKSNPPYDWLSSQQADGSLWWDDTDTGVNNPCPVGYHVPTKAEWLVEYFLSYEIWNIFFTSLKLPMAGYRNNNGDLFYSGNDGIYWSSTVDGTNACTLDFSIRFGGTMDGYTRAAGLSVRCIKD